MGSCWATGQAFLYASAKIRRALPPFSTGPKFSLCICWLLWSFSCCPPMPPICQHYLYHSSRVSEGLETEQHGAMAIGMLPEPQEESQGEGGSWRQRVPRECVWSSPRAPKARPRDACEPSPGRARLGSGAARTAGEKGGFVSATQSMVWSHWPQHTKDKGWQMPRSRL